MLLASQRGGKLAWPSWQEGRIAWSLTADLSSSRHSTDIAPVHDVAATDSSWTPLDLTEFEPPFRKPLRPCSLPALAENQASLLESAGVVIRFSNYDTIQSQRGHLYDPS